MLRMKINDMPLYYKLMLIFGTSLGIGFLVTMMLMRMVGNTYNTILYEQADNAMSYFSGNLENALKEIEELSASTISDRVIQEEMDAILGMSRSDYAYSVSQSRLEDQLMRNFYSENDLVAMSLIQEGRLIVSAGKAPSLDVYNQLGILENDGALKNKEWICVPTDYSLLYIRKIRKIRNLSLQELGYLVIRIDFDKMILKSINARYQDAESQMLLIRKADETLYSTSDNTGLAEESDWENGYQIMDVDGSKMFVTHNRIKNYGWDVFYGIPYNKIFHSVTTVWVLAISVLCLIFVLVCIICNRGISYIMWHFTYLAKKIERFKEDRAPTFEPEVYDYQDRRDEIAYIHRSFDGMTMEINNLIQENYEKQIVIRDARIKILEQQMNPHFLYNMLQIIEWHAKLSDRETTASIVNTLGSYLRNTMKDKPEKVLLRQELEIVDDYIKLIKARYEDEVIFMVEIEEECLDSMILRMIIQPLVENAVYYGISESDEEIRVTIDAHREGNVLVVRVCNTGSEIDEHILEHLESGEIVANGNGIGLRNIQERLQLTYGMEYGLSFSSGNQMTAVMIRIPFEGG